VAEIVLTYCGIGVDLRSPNEQQTFLTLQRKSDGASLLIGVGPEEMNRIISFAEGGSPAPVAQQEVSADMEFTPL
jgi:hypothetical protein